jgi:hypothetical protein
MTGFLSFTHNPSSQWVTHLTLGFVYPQIYIIHMLLACGTINLVRHA